MQVPCSLTINGRKRPRLWLLTNICTSGGNDHVQIFLCLVQMIICKYLYICLRGSPTCSGAQTMVCPVRSPSTTRPSSPCFSTRPCFEQTSEDCHRCKVFAWYPFSFLTTPYLKIWDKRTLIISSWYQQNRHLWFFCFRTLIESICYQQMHDMLCFFCFIEPKSIFKEYLAHLVKSVVISHRAH